MHPNSQRKLKPGRDPALDGLRGVAILLVYIFHYGGGLRSTHVAVRAFGYLTQAGWVGLELFFALSGYLITGLLWKNLPRPNALRNFYTRRALRILPVYCGALIAAAIAALAIGAHFARLWPLLLYLGFLQNIPWLVHDSLRYPPPLPLHHLWSLAVEEQFYVLWPFLLLAAATRRRAFHLCLWTFALSCIFRVAIFAPHALSGATIANWSPFLLTRAGALALGGALALREPGLRNPVQRSIRPKWPLPAFAGATIAFALTGLRCHSFVLTQRLQFVLMLPAVEIASVAVLALALEHGLWRRLLSGRPLRALGRISYGFYVLHILLEPLFDHIGRWAVHAGTGSGYQTARLFAAFPITFAAAWLSYTCLERPFLRLKRFFPRERTGEGLAGAR